MPQNNIDRKSEIQEVLKRVEETLDTAKQGLSDLVEPSRTRRNTGLRNLIANGRAVTFVIQNLRGIQGLNFDAWYEPLQLAMKSDPLMRYFIDARNELEKQGKLSVGTRGCIKFSSTDDIKKLGRPPVGAKNFFIGGLGGSGWEVKLDNGQTEKYYVDLPSSIGELTQHFTNFPAAKAPELAGKSIDDLCTMYIANLDSLVRQAKTHFLGEPEQTPPTVRTRAHLRLVK